MTEYYQARVVWIGRRKYDAAIEDSVLLSIRSAASFCGLPICFGGCGNGMLHWGVRDEVGDWRNSKYDDIF